MRHRGPINPRRLSEDAMAALACGDVQALIEANRREFGGFVMMADDNDDDDDADKDEDKSDDDSDDDGDADDKKKKSDDDGDDSELERLRKRMQAADQRAAKAEQALRKIEDAQKDDLTKAQDRVTELETENKELQSRLSDLNLQNAFLTANKITWHDPDTALALAQSRKYLEDVVDEESGDVDRKALGKALERLSKEHAYLVKSEDKKKDDEPDSPSGEPAGGRSDNTKDDKAKKKAMRNRFPVLNR